MTQTLTSEHRGNIIGGRYVYCFICEKTTYDLTKRRVLDEAHREVLALVIKPEYLAKGE